MDKLAKRQPLLPHHDQSTDTPWHWITLPVTVRLAALEHPLTQGMFPSHVGYFPNARNHYVEREQGIDQAIVKYCIKGQGWCKLGSVTHAVEKGDVFVIPVGVAHAYGSDRARPWTVHWFHAMGLHLGPLLARLGVTAARPVVHAGLDTALINLFVELRQSMETDYAESQLLYASQILAHLLGRMIQLRHGAPTPTKTAVERIRASIAHMKQHLTEPLAINRLAELACLSQSHYSAQFRAITGYAPKNYLVRLRVHRAAQLLDTTDLDIKTIARDSGFTDPFYFSRAFRQIHDVAPREYRQRKHG
jgi:AraC family transcriptional regulator of arabinose operon